MKHSMHQIDDASDESESEGGNTERINKNLWVPNINNIQIAADSDEDEDDDFDR